jgi:hypothetical protein
MRLREKSELRPMDWACKPEDRADMTIATAINQRSIDHAVAEAEVKLFFMARHLQSWSGHMLSIEIWQGKRISF